MRTGTENQIELLMLRHGATDSNAEGRYLGSTDEDLSADGRNQLLKKKERCKEQNPVLVFSGPMARCRQTAELLFDKSPIIIPEWTEIDFGDFEGKNYLDLTGDPDYQAWIDSGGTLPFPGGESREEFTDRSVRGLEHMLEETDALLGDGGKDPVRVAAVVHGGTIMSIMSTLTGGEYFDFHPENGEGFLILLERNGSGKPELLNSKRA